MVCTMPFEPALASLVTVCVGFDAVSWHAGAHRGLPSTSVVVLLSIGDPILAGWWDVPGTASPFLSLASGLHLQPAAIGGGQRQPGVMLRLTPTGSRALLGVPAAALAGHLVDLPTVAPHLAELPGRVAEASSWPQRLQLVQQALLGALLRGAGGTVRPAVAAAISELSPGTTVQAVASRVGWSRRHLSTAFRAELGVTPKQYQRMARLEASRRHLVAQSQATRLSLAAVAATSGYADQAHLAREWGALAGCPPSAWLRSQGGHGG